MLPGEKELADKLLNLSRTAREQEATIPEQCKILHEMGELYFKDAIETGNGEQFVKASALINAALVRTEDPNDQKTLQGVLHSIYEGVVTGMKQTPFHISHEDLVAKANRNKAILHKIRAEIEGMCENMKHFLDSDVYRKSKETEKEEIERIIVEEVLKVSQRVQTRMLQFIKILWDHCLTMCSICPPCRYAVIGLGSLARQETTPYSDLEFALLIEKDSGDIKEYFRNLVYLFHLHVIDLGETPLPAMAIESLNDFLTPGGDKLFDKITPCGFRLDGAMPWACKTPIGRKKTPQKEPLDLIKTPEEMASLLQEDSVLGQAYNTAAILSNYLFLHGNSDIFNKYKMLSTSTLLMTNYKEMARKYLIEDYNRSPNWNILKYAPGNKLESKSIFYRLPSSFVENLRLFFTPDYLPNSSWQALDHLYKKDFISEEGCSNLKLHVALCYGFRLVTYLKNKGQYELMAFLHKKENMWAKARTQNCLQARTDNRIACFGLSGINIRMIQGSEGLRNVVEQCFMQGDIMNITFLKDENFTTKKYKIHCCICIGELLTNLEWARSFKELPIKGCGSSCYINRFADLCIHYSDPSECNTIYKALADLIDIGTRECKCFLLLRMHLLVLKAQWLKRYNIKGIAPKEANVSKLHELYRQKSNTRERFYLLLDISNLLLAGFSADQNFKVSVIESITKFCEDMINFDQSQQTILNVVKYDLMKNLVLLCVEAGLLDQAISICQDQIDEGEWKYGPNSLFPKLTEWYGVMGDLKHQTSCLSEAADYYHRAFVICKELYIMRRYNDEGFKSIFLPHTKQLALKMAKLYRDQQKQEDAIEILEDCLTTIPIQTDDDLAILSQLVQNCLLDGFTGSQQVKDETLKYKYVQKANQHFENALDMIIKKEGNHCLDPSLITRLLRNLVLVLTYLDASFMDFSFVVENVYKKYCQEKDRKTLKKQGFLLEIVGILLDDESLHNFFLHGVHSPDEVSTEQVDLKTFIQLNDFFSSLCKFPVPCESNKLLILPFVEFRLSLLKQANIFCDKVVKKMVSNEIYQMCLTLIDFNRIVMMLSHHKYRKDAEQLITIHELTEKTRSCLQLYFPTCSQAFKLTALVLDLLEMQTKPVKHYKFCEKTMNFYVYNE